MLFKLLIKKMYNKYFILSQNRKQVNNCYIILLKVNNKDNRQHQ